MDFQFRQNQEYRKVITLFPVPSVFVSSFLLLLLLFLLLLAGDFCQEFFKVFMQRKVKDFLRARRKKELNRRYLSKAWKHPVHATGHLFCSVLRELNMQPLPTPQLCIVKAACHNSRAVIPYNLMHRFSTIKLIFYQDR